MDDNTKEIISESIKDFGKDVYNDGLQPVIKEAGGAMGTLIGFFNNVVLYPLRKLNIKFQQKAKAFEKEMEEKYNKIPENNRVEPPINVVGPALESLKYNIDEEHIRNMFKNILVNSMDNRVSNLAHPKFIKIIEQMNNNDAVLFSIIYNKSEPHSYICSPRIVFNEEHNMFTNVPQYYSNINTPLDLFAESIALNNLANLGLIEMSFVEFAKDKQVYKNIIDSDKATALLKEFNELTEFKDAKYKITKEGIVRLTDIGRSFAKVCL
ncbi:MAG: DUF4393 domain-containing protein [Clostridia bacterium]|nr:DUF4393 domain-containing protein [Clostridia bacterium]